MGVILGNYTATIDIFVNQMRIGDLLLCPTAKIFILVESSATITSIRASTTSRRAIPASVARSG